MECYGSQLKDLADLLKVEESDSDEDQPKKSSVARMGPGDIGPKTQTDGKSSGKEAITKKSTKDIWDVEEIVEGAEFDDSSDPRPQPEYEIVYRQAVTSEDIYLQMGNKNPSTASCEDMVVRIKLPNTKLTDVNLDVKDTFLDCRTPKHKLGLFLPYPVDSKNAKAQWDGNQEKLFVTMRMTRPYDFINF